MCVCVWQYFCVQSVDLIFPLELLLHLPKIYSLLFLCNPDIHLHARYTVAFNRLMEILYLVYNLYEYDMET